MFQFTLGVISHETYLSLLSLLFPVCTELKCHNMLKISVFLQEVSLYDRVILKIALKLVNGFGAKSHSQILKKTMNFQTPSKIVFFLLNLSRQIN